MTRTVHPHEIIVSLCIFAVLAVALFGGGYWVGHRGMDDLQANYKAVVGVERYLFQLADDEGWEGTDALRVNAECHGDASDWATVRMANEIARRFDIPAYVHGNCQTHAVVDLPVCSGDACH
jgi:hypothetical protein